MLHPHPRKPVLAWTRLANRNVLALASLALLAVPAAAHQYWLAPSRYLAPPGLALSVRAFAGTGFRGDWKPWSPLNCVKFVARTDRVIDLTRGASLGSDQWAMFAAVDPRGVLLAYESNFVPIAHTSRQFDEYLHEEGLTGPMEARRKSASRDTVRERYRRCAKSWLPGNAGPPPPGTTGERALLGPDTARATTPIGQPLEIVPLALPGSGPSLRVRVLAEGRPLAAALLRAWRAPLDSLGLPTDAAIRDSVAMALEARTDARGEALVPCAAEGEWLVSVVDMRPSRDKKAAEWESTWASLTFARPAPYRVRR